MNDIILSNNRFLGHTNPIMAAAVADGGSVQDREYIQRAARGIVDAGHLSSLKFWGVSGLPKLRNSGGVDYVPKLYDLSGEGNDGTQTTEASQPVWSVTGLDFDASNDFIDIGTLGTFASASLATFTVAAWVKTSSTAAMSLSSVINTLTNVNGGLIIHFNRDQTPALSAGKIRIFIRGYVGATTVNKQAATTDATNVNNGSWHHFAMTHNGTSNFTLLIDGSSKALTYNGTTNPDDYEDFDVGLYIGGHNDRGSLILPFDGEINDYRIYNAALSETEIAAIYNQTSYRYA